MSWKASFARRIFGLAACALWHSGVAAKEPIDPELFSFLGGWEASEEEAYTPLEWLEILDATAFDDNPGEIEDPQDSEQQTDSERLE
ncbi:hypothetical protein L1F30_08550 [Simiduia sp. 21SJ11W-1]|uniref:hypothetical protein n=1 Tax=Simiduia sp. 21SJ11W-1 TaxID=2909669 RepID=UPI0020A09070|nr:hypothetical protein [Simiduia sp. 21SJ11W-1]UTA49570.1 hypothetical protein L1F30_08550 [Simiduia sp. 21SJ11W-1]